MRTWSGYCAYSAFMKICKWIEDFVINHLTVRLDQAQLQTKIIEAQNIELLKII